MKQEYNVSFHCYYKTQGNITRHMQRMPLKDIPRWIEAYMFTHPEVVSISVKIWMNGQREERK